MSTNEFVGQFALSCARQPSAPPSWVRHSIDGWHLAMHPALPIHSIVDPVGKSVGWILGYPIDTETQQMQVGPLKLAAPASPQNAETTERQISGLAGRYVVVLLGGGLKRLYPDPCASLSILYDAQQARLASTIGLLDGVEPAHAQTVRALDAGLGTHGTWYPCGITPWRDIRVLRPNHYLDLASWTVRRFWPTSPPSTVATRRQRRAAVAEIARRITGNVRAVADRHPTDISLTAGRDTRMTLACSRTMVDRLRFTTLASRPGVDTFLAGAMADFLGLQHVTSDAAAPDRALLKSACGEIGRGFYWRAGDEQLDGISARELCARMQFDPLFVGELETWLAELRSLPRCLILDIAYIEHRVAMAHAPAEYEEANRYLFSLFPMNDRKIIELMLSLPPAYRMKQKLADAIVRQCWPQLHTFPINATHQTGWRKYRALLASRPLAKKGNRRLLRTIVCNERSVGRMLLDDAAKLTGTVLGTTWRQLQTPGTAQPSQRPS